MVVMVAAREEEKMEVEMVTVEMAVGKEVVMGEARVAVLEEATAAVMVEAKEEVMAAVVVEATVVLGYILVAH